MCVFFLNKKDYIPFLDSLFILFRRKSEVSKSGVASTSERSGPQRSERTADIASPITSGGVSFFIIFNLHLAWQNLIGQRLG